MPKETVEQKAERLVLTRKVSILSAGSYREGGRAVAWEIAATVQGSEKQPYRVVGTQEGFTCTCVAQVPWCSHRLAVLLVAGFREPEDVPF